MAIHFSTLTLSILIMLVSSATVILAAEDMSIISYNEKHHSIGSESTVQRADDEVMALYESWLVEHKKVYNALGEKDKRFQIFKDNLRYIDEQNAMSGKSYKLGLTQFSDLTNEEYRKMYLGTKGDGARRLSNRQSDRYAPKVGDSLPDSVDWREKGVLVGVKNQGQCGKLTNIRYGIYLNTRSSMSCSATPAMAREKEMEQVDRILAAKEDDHGGVIVEMTNEPLDPSVFGSLLRASLSHWRQQGKKGVWIKLPIELVTLIEPAVKEGFYYHHAEPKYLMLVSWLPGTANTIPANATHRVGISAFVVNEKNEVLVVQEKSGRFRGTGVWKFPTGVVDEGEDISDAAVREVKEETGVDAKFVEILAFRQSHKSFFDKSDLFFVCMLQPLSFDIKKQDAEIEAAEWMPFEQYTAQPFVQGHDLLRNISDICSGKMEGRYTGFSSVPTVTSFSEKKTYLYMNNNDRATGHDDTNVTGN